MYSSDVYKKVTHSVSRKGYLAMVILFAQKLLKRLANDDRKALAQMGRQRAEKYRLRLSQLSDANCLEDLRYMPGNYHELRADRKGQWSCDLDQPYRLVFAPLEDPIPADVSGRYVWSEIRGVSILEIVNYHKEG